MNGTEVKLWKGLDGFPNKMLPGGYVMGHTGVRPNAFGLQDQIDLVQVDFDGKIVWKFDRGESSRTLARSPSGWPANTTITSVRATSSVITSRVWTPYVDHGNTWVLCHKNVFKKEITDKRLLDDVIIEATWEGDVVWESISPYRGSLMHMNMVYRAYRVPYEWVPQLERPEQTPIKKIDVSTFRVPGAAPLGPRRVTAVEGVRPYQGDAALCVQVDVRK
jgi:hypothetical protein